MQKFYNSRGILSVSHLPAKARKSTTSYYNSYIYLTTTHYKMPTKSGATRWAALSRDTNETTIQLALNLDGGEFPPETDSRLQVNGADGHASQSSKSQTISINTGIGFLDHMLHALAKHAGWSLALACKGDLHSEHHPTPRPFLRPCNPSISGADADAGGIRPRGGLTGSAL